MNKKFDFSEIDEALPAAEKMQEQEHIINALENNYEAVRILSANVEKLENRLSEALPKMDGAVSSLRGASTVTVGEEARKTLEQEGEKICRKMADRMERECARLAGRLSANDRVLISATAFWCMVEAIISLAAGFCLYLHGKQPVHTQSNAVENTWLYGRFSCTLYRADHFYMPQVKTMKHYQLNKYKYDNSKSEIPPVDSRRPSGHYRLFCNSPPCRQANHNRL